MPKRILFVGLFFCIYAVLAAVSIAEAWMNLRPYFHFGIFLFPVGVGLLQGRPRAREWARCCVVLGYITAAVVPLYLIIYMAVKRAQAGDRVPAAVLDASDTVPRLMLWAICLVIAAVIVQAVLNSEKAKAYFERKRRQSPEHLEQLPIEEP